MAKDDTGNTHGAFTVLRLPEATTLTYPVKIIEILVSEGTRIEADKTPLYKVMQADGKRAVLGCGLDGTVARILIRPGDIATEPLDTFEIGLRDRVSAPKPAPRQDAPVPPAEEKPAASEQESAAPPMQEKSAAPTQTEAAAPVREEPAPRRPQRSVKENHAPQKAPKKAAAIRRKSAKRAAQKPPRTRSRLVKLVKFFGVVAVWGGGFAAFLFIMMLDEANMDLWFKARLPTKLYYVGDTPETASEYSAEVSVPSGQGESRETLSCDLTRGQYNEVRDYATWSGETRYARWRLWRSKIFRNVNCDFMPQDDFKLRQDLDPGYVRDVYDARYLDGLRKHDARAAERGFFSLQ